MSEISIQVRRVTERVKSFFNIFGFRSSAAMYPGRSIVRGSKRLGFDEVECVIQETARGTSVGFYAINSLQGLIYAIPLLSILLLQILNSIDVVSEKLTGENSFLSINWLKLLSGNATINARFVFIIILLAMLPLLIDLANQRIRLANLKSRFSFFTRDAIWETRETPSSLIALSASRSVFNHVWLLSILYFSLFSFSEKTIQEVCTLYNSNVESIYLATADAFSMTAGMVLGLLSAEKAIKLRADSYKVDKRLRITGGLLERRLEPMLYGLQASLFSSIIFGLFLSVTFMSQASSSIAFQLFGFALLGGIITGLIHSEGPIWVSSAYGILIFFSSLIYIFRTGANPEYAFIVIVQLFIIPFPFILLLVRSFQDVMKKEDIQSSDWIYDTTPLFALISIFIQSKKRKESKERYLKSLDEEINEAYLEERIRFSKSLLLDRNASGHRIARHYYDLLLSYTASFDDDKFIYFPTSNQLINWIAEQSEMKVGDIHIELFDFIDRLLWDPQFLPTTQELNHKEEQTEKIVLAIK